VTPPQPFPTEVPMRLIGLAVVLAFSLLAPLAEAQQAGKVPRIGYLVLSPLTERPSPERAAFSRVFVSWGGSRERRSLSNTAQRNGIPRCSMISLRN
jgi:hypothetical protein